MKVIFFKRIDGSKPAGEFIKSIKDLKLKAKVIRSVQLLEDYGHNLKEPDSKHLEDGIFELRTKQSSNIARCLYFFTIGDTVVITNGFIKKQERTPIEEIQLAKKYRKEYERRYLR